MELETQHSLPDVLQIEFHPWRGPRESGGCSNLAMGGRCDDVHDIVFVLDSRQEQGAERP